jgi:hypothetical protein
MHRNVKGFLALILACFIPAVLLTALSYHQDVMRVEIKNKFAEIDAQLKQATHTDQSGHLAPSVVPQTPLPPFSLNVYGTRCAILAAYLALIWAIINVLYISLKRAFGVKSATA